MWFFAEINRNTEMLVDLVSDKDVFQIAKIIGAEGDNYICSRISFELAVHDGSCNIFKSISAGEPILVQAFDVLNEKFILDNKDSRTKLRLEKVTKKLKDIDKLLNYGDVKDLLVNSEDLKKQDIASFKSTSLSIQGVISNLLYNSNKHRKKVNYRWGKLGAYKSFLVSLADLYCELTGEPFTVDFYKGKMDGSWEPITKGTEFLYEFHVILNKIAKIYSCKPFTDSNFKNTCSKIRTSLNRL